MEQIIPSGTPESELPPQSSIAARFFNIIASPGEVYSEIKNSPPNFWNWLWPVIIYVLIGSVCTPHGFLAGKYFAPNS